MHVRLHILFDNSLFVLFVYLHACFSFALLLISLLLPLSLLLFCCRRCCCCCCCQRNQKWTKVYKDQKKKKKRNIEQQNKFECLSKVKDFTQLIQEGLHSRLQYKYQFLSLRIHWKRNKWEKNKVKYFIKSHLLQLNWLRWLKSFNIDVVRASKVSITVFKKVFVNCGAFPKYVLFLCVDAAV